MITGDYHHTAVAVAKGVGMVKADRQVVVIDTVHREAVRHDESAVQSPDVGNSTVTTPLTSPQASFHRRNADFAHGFFGLSLGGGGQASVTSLQAANSISATGAGDRTVSFKVRETSRVSFREGSVSGKSLPVKPASSVGLPIDSAFASRRPVEAAHSEEVSPKIRRSLGRAPDRLLHPNRLSRVSGSPLMLPIQKPSLLSGFPFSKHLPPGRLSELPPLSAFLAKLQLPWQLHLLSHLVRTPSQASGALVVIPPRLSWR